MTRTSGADSLTVNYTIRLLNYDAVPPPTPASATFSAGDSSVTVSVPFERNVSGVWVDLVPGSGYDVGQPDHSIINVLGDPFCSYPRFLAQVPANLRQTISVGEQPAAFTFARPDAGLVPATTRPMPPGLTLEQDGTWTGNATRAGTYAVQLGCTCDDAAQFVFQLTVGERDGLVRTGMDSTWALALIGVALVAGGLATDRVARRLG
jgi:hypothetical protein